MDVKRFSGYVNVGRMGIWVRWIDELNGFEDRYDRTYRRKKEECGWI